MSPDNLIKGEVPEESGFQGMGKIHSEVCLIHNGYPFDCDTKSFK